LIIKLTGIDNMITHLRIVLLSGVFALLAGSLNAQAQSWKWAKRAGTTGDNLPFTSVEEQVTDVKVDKAGNIYATAYCYANPSFQNGQIFGETTPNGFGLQDAYLIKYSACGKTLWSRRMGGTGYDQANSLVLDNSGHVLVLGTCSNGAGNKKFGDGLHDTLVAYGSNLQFIAKFDTAGNFKEVKEYPWAYGKMLKNSVGDYIVTDGLTGATINTLGAVTFTYAFISVTPYYPEIYGIALDKNDNIYLSGLFNNTVNIGPGTILLPTPSTAIPNANAVNSLIMKFSPSGNMLWYKRGNSSVSDALEGCTVDTSGTKVVTGGAIWNGGTLFSYYANTGVGTYANLFLILDAATGTLISAKTGTLNYQGYITPTYTDRDNNFICTGSINGFLAFNTTSYSAAGPSGNRQNCIGKFDATGNFNYISLLPQVGSTSGFEKIKGLDVSEQGNIYIGGMFGGTLDSLGVAVNIIGGQEDGFVAKYGFACNSNASSLSPLAPTSLTATSQAPTTNYVSWIDNSNYETGFELWAMGGSMPTYSLIATLAANTTTYNHVNLQQNTTYCYKARATNTVGPSVYTNIACVTTGSTTGITQQTALADLSIYPNPTSGAVTLQFVSTATSAQVQVMDNMGRLLISRQIPTSAVDNRYQLDLPLVSGLYIVNLSTGSATLVKKVVVE